MKSDLPRRVYEKHGAYYHVRAEGASRVWTKLCRVKDGLPAMYRALAELAAADVLDDSMPRLIGEWLKAVGSTHSKKTQTNDAYMCREIGKAFVEFRASQVTPPDVVDFLKVFKDRPRSYNAYRSQIRELMRFAIELGWRQPGTNPVDSLRTMALKARNRYITDSELRRIKVAACYGADKRRTRSGPMLCALIDMAYLTGQRIGDLLTMEWSELGRDGILFEPNKVSGSTGAKVLIGWTPKLQDVVRRLRGFKKRHIKYIFVTQDGQPYTYYGASTAWKRAVKRAGIRGVHFHDLRAKALTDVDQARGIGQAQRMGGHSTQSQTADYVRHKTAVKTDATR
jgi:integrase